MLTAQAVVADWETWWVSEPIAATRAVVWGPNSQWALEIFKFGSVVFPFFYHIIFTAVNMNPTLMVWFVFRFSLSLCIVVNFYFRVTLANRSEQVQILHVKSASPAKHWAYETR